MTNYLQAILNARQGKNAEAAQWLQKALKLDSSLKAYANNDLELLNVNK